MISGWFNFEANTTRYFDVFRLLPDGTIDTEFGIDPYNEGSSVFNSNNGYNTEFHDFKVMSSGKGLFCGEFIKEGVTHNGDIFALCMNSNGSLDNSFGTNSYKVFEFSTGVEDNGFSIAEIKNQALNIQWQENVTEEINIELCDINGRKIYETKLMNKSDRLLFPLEINSGIYLLKISGKNLVQIKKIIIQ